MELKTVQVMLTARATVLTAKEIFMANATKDNKLSWRMVYAGKQILALFQSNGTTYTRNPLFNAETKDECITKANALGLVIPPEVLDPEAARGAVMVEKP
jgi:hypothetical protein